VCDPAPLVYARLFEKNPETEALSCNSGGQVRGQMLAITFEALLDPARGGRLDGMVGASVLEVPKVLARGQRSEWVSLSGLRLDE